VAKRRIDTSVKIDAGIAYQAKIVAAYRDQTLAEYLSETLRPIVERDLQRHNQNELQIPAPRSDDNDDQP
jgi:hypothetical protein